MIAHQRHDLTRTWVCVLMCAVAGSTAAHAGDWNLSLDLRAVSADSRESFLGGGQGKFRFDEQHNGLRLGRLFGSWNQRIGESFAAHMEASTWDNYDKSFVDFTEAYMEYAPRRAAGFTPRVRLGAFYPPMSLENRAAGWETPYTLTPSAISTWVGEEVRTIGLEGQIDWLGAHRGRGLDLQLTAALFGWNDPIGTMLAFRGFAFHDRQSTLFGRVGEPVPSNAPKREPFLHEIDRRAGYYVGAQARYLDSAVINVLHYDNRADPTAYAPSLRAWAWETRFDAAALRVDTLTGWSFLAQWLSGETFIAPNGALREWRFDSYSTLLAKSVGRHLFTVRYDDFEVERPSPAASGNERGHAWAAAYSVEYGENWRVTLEWLQVESNVTSRRIQLGEPEFARESKLELGVRYALGSTPALEPDGDMLPPLIDQ
jgi:hypothetical protein